MRLLAQDDHLDEQWSQSAYTWMDDSVQFPRLIAEINATQDHLDIESLADSMDLETGDVHELFNRADRAWELAKRRLGDDDKDDGFDDDKPSPPEPVPAAPATV